MTIYDEIASRLYDDARLIKDKRTSITVTIEINTHKMFNLCTPEQQKYHHIQRKSHISRNTGQTYDSYYRGKVEVWKTGDKQKRQAQLIKTYMNDKHWRYLETTHSFVLQNKPSRHLIKNREVILQELKTLLSLSTDNPISFEITSG